MEHLPVQKKTLAKLGLGGNDVVASKPSEFALRLLKKYGWNEGEGLGKRKQGRATHVRVEKRSDNRGVGCRDSKNLEDFANQWWNQGFDNILSRLNTGTRRVGEDDDTSDSSDSDSGDEDAKLSLARDMSTYANEDIELFNACRGRRCGKRAGRLQSGKIKRELRADEAFKRAMEGKEKTRFHEAASQSTLLVQTKRKIKDTNGGCCTEEEVIRIKKTKRRKKSSKRLDGRDK